MPTASIGPVFPTSGLNGRARQITTRSGPIENPWLLSLVVAKLKGCGYRVTASDPVRELVNAAKEARSADDYAIASGSDLPFEDARFDLVMAYNVLMDVEDVSATLKEIRRVLRPSGMLVVSIVHPF